MSALASTERFRFNMVSFHQNTCSRQLIVEIWLLARDYDVCVVIFYFKFVKSLIFFLPQCHWGAQFICYLGKGMAYTGCCQYLLCMKWLMYGKLLLGLSTLGCFRPETCFSNYGQVTMDLLYIRYTYLTKDNQQNFSRLNNWFSLRCLGPWINRLPMYGFLFMCMYSNDSWCVSLIQWRGSFWWFHVFMYVFDDT